MRKIAFLLCLVSTSALAQQQPAQPYSPITLDQKTYEDLRRAIGQVRFDEALPVREEAFVSEKAEMDDLPVLEDGVSLGEPTESHGERIVLV